jgi:hypothetical protein
MSALLALFIAGATPELPASSTASHEASLTKLLQSKDYGELTKLVLSPKSKEEFRSNLDWLSVRWQEGSTALVPFLYARLLEAATRGKADEQAAQLRGTALAAMLYVYGVASIDGARCGDRSAPTHRQDQMIEVFSELLKAARFMSFEMRQEAVGIAVGMERKTADARDAAGDVEFFCRYGLEETQYNLKYGTAQEVPARPGQFGRQVVLTGDGKYVPSTIAESIWRPIALKARAEMPNSVGKLVGIGFQQPDDRPPAGK